MQLFDRFKKLVASFILVCFIPSQAWAQGLVIPAGASLNINSGQLKLPGDIVNQGKLVATTGSLSLTGNWTNSGTFTAGTGTVDFNATTGPQTISNGASGGAFYNLTHTTDSAVALSGNSIVINNNFTNTPPTTGSFNAAGLDMTVDGTWDNKAPSTFIPGNDTVTLAGGSQSVIGSTTFYKFAKNTVSPVTLTFDHNGTQLFTNSLTMMGAGGGLLSIRSDGTIAANIGLLSPGVQSIGFVDVKDSNASGGVELVAVNSPDHSIGWDNNNWLFPPATLTWIGNTSSDWNTPSNWDKGFVPSSADAVIIPGSTTNEPDLCPVGTCLDVNLAALSIASTASLTLSGYGLAVTGTFSNSGNVILAGTETVALPQQDATNPGTFTYIGNNTSTPLIIPKFSGTADYYNLVVDSGTTPFEIDSNIKTAGNLTVASGSLTVLPSTSPAPPHTLTVGNVSGDLILGDALAHTNGTLNAAAANITADGSVNIATNGSVMTAPQNTNIFTVAGNFTDNGTFNNSSGTVVLNGGNQQVLGSTTFYNFTKTVTTPGNTLSFDSAANTQQTFTHNLTLGGDNTTDVLAINSTGGTPAYIALISPGTQEINNVAVVNSDASRGLLLVGRGSSTGGAGDVNWSFGNVALTWTGHSSSDWNNPDNWDLGVVPAAGDTITIPVTANQPELCPIGTCTQVSLGSLAIASGASLTLDGTGLAVTGTFANSGNVIMEGTEPVALTQDTVNTGTFTYVGDNTSTPIVVQNIAGTADYYDLVLDRTTNPFQIASNVTTAGSLTVASGTLSMLANSSSGGSAYTLTVGSVSGDLILGDTTYNTNGAFNAALGNIAADGAVNIATAGSSLTAPGSSDTFTIAGNFTDNGTFINSSGTVNFTTTAQAVISGNSTFNNFTSTAAGKTIEFAAQSTQTVNGIFNVMGVRGSPISLLSATPGSLPANQWNLAISGVQNVSALTVLDSNAQSSGSSNFISCLNCNQGTPTPFYDSTLWHFDTLYISAPAVGTTVGTTPTIVGFTMPNTAITIKDGFSHVVATTTSDANGNFRVAVAATSPLATGSNSLTPYLTATNTPGLANTINVVGSPSAAEVPVITSPANNTSLIGFTPTIVGQGAPNEAVTVQALDANGNLLLSAGSGTTDQNGDFSIILTTPLPIKTNYLSVIVGDTSNETASALITVYYSETYGYVFEANSNQLIQGAVVTLYNATTKQPATGIQACTAVAVCTNSSIFTTTADGFYSFLAPPGRYYIVVTDTGYTYPSKLTSVPAGRFIATGSKGEVFNVGTTALELDQPVDGNGFLLRITKTADKSEAHIGDIVTYTVNIQNLSINPVGSPADNIVLNDRIPPGFKYVHNRVLLGGLPIADPTGQRPVLFNLGIVPPSTSLVLEYQLVIGTGVTMGNYQNTAVAQYVQTGVPVSNPASSSVKVILDPIFDLGTVIGKVFFDWNENGIQDPPFFDPISHQTVIEKPVPNVQIVMEDGTVITTDRNGEYNIPGLLPGRHLFRLDERTLPPGAYLTTDKGVIADITAGSIAKVNFGVNIDQTLLSGKDAVFFNEKIRLVQDRNRPVPRLNAALFNASADADPKKEEVLLHEGALVRQAEFRVFTNYWPFISSWHLDILDADTKKLIRRFEGTPMNINDPVYWNGRDTKDMIISPDHRYSYVLTVTDDNNNHDNTKERLITVREIKDDVLLKKELDHTKEVLKDRADRYRKWVDAQTTVNDLDHQLIQIRGETIHMDRQGTNVRTMRVMKADHLFTDIPLVEQYGLTPQELMAGGFSSKVQKDNLEIILPNGDYTLDVTSVKTPDNDSTVNPSVPIGSNPDATSVTAPVPANSGPSKTAPSISHNMMEHYSRPLQVGDDYMLFVALGDAKVGYNIDRGNIESVQDRSQMPGFYSQGKAAYYLKGQILGKYLITSSYDTDRQQKALFRSLDPNTYYPVYGDGSSINYDAANTQGPLYLRVEWDKSSAILGNYAVDFNDTEFAAFSRAYYGGKLDYQSVASNSYGDARTKLVVYHAQVQQLPSHNEFLATGGSLYFLKYKNVVQGSETVTIQVRDQTTGLVLGSQTMTNGADYELDNGQGRILFWQPVAMIAQSNSIISNNLINGNPIYVVIDYQYEASNLQIQGAQGIRVAQAVGDNLVLGGTSVQDNSSGQNYTLTGTDATLHVDRDTTLKAEYAQTTSQEQGSYVSTDGGITFTPLMLDNSARGKAYGIQGDSRLFDNIGLKSYYKWIGSDFGSSTTTSQQGKESMGMSMTFDMTPVTRLTASEDIQRLLAGGNLQTSAQVGASETDTTMVQIVHTAERLKLTGQFQMIEVKSTVDGITSTTNQKGATMAGEAQYDLTDRIKLTAGQQLDVMNNSNTATTLGIADRITDHMTLHAQEVFAQTGHALTAGVTNQLTNKIALTTDYTLTNFNTGAVDKTASVMVSDQINKNISTTATVAQTASSTGTNITSASVGTKAKISDGMTLDMSLGKTQNALGAQGGTSVNLNGTTQIGNTTVTGTAQATGGASTAFTPSNPLGIGTTGVDASGATPSSLTPASGVTTMSSFGVQATTKVDNNNTTNGSVTVGNESTGAQSKTIGFGNTSKIDQELQAVTDNSFSFSPDTGTTDQSKYGLVRTLNGQKTEADYTRQLANQPTATSQSNIFGLSGDVNDKLALNASVESGKVQNLDTSKTKRIDFSVGSGYVLKDTETAVERLKNSTKLELRIDRGVGTDSLRQYVLYDALEGKLTDNLTGNFKVDYSKTIDTTTGAIAERHQEIILGMAYRPINFDNLNFITEYSYQSGYGGGTQQADALNTMGQQTVAQVFSGQAIYDINDHWQAAEKIAYRIENEQDTGFEFTQTHTWLVIHRLNYKIDADWMIGGEYRDLTQVEAKDDKQGILLEAIRHINDSTELAVGWNFTKFSDDLTNLSYTSQGPYVRMTGKFYDRSPAEKARARAKWLDARINDWAWIMVRKELSKKDSKIMLELNRMFAIAHAAQVSGHLEESRQIYKDIIAAGQMMIDEASEYIRGRIAFEEKLQQSDKSAQEYFKGGEYVKARKIWEKVVDEASSGMVK